MRGGRRTVGCNSRGSFCLFAKDEWKRKSMSGVNGASKRREHQIIDFGFSFFFYTGVYIWIDFTSVAKKEEKKKKKQEDTKNSDPSRDKLVSAVLCAADARKLLMCMFVCWCEGTRTLIYDCLHSFILECIILFNL